MTGPALVMMIVALLVIWGGLALAILNLRRNPGTADPHQARRDL